MHVLFVSACEKRAIKRTRTVLDSYALRTGEKAWASPMTQEGLREIRAALKATATRQTAVACYRNEGRQRMKLLWVVGSRKAFGPDGHFPAGTTQVKSAMPIPTWVRVASLLAQAAGWCHDLGKASLLFQDKLAAPIPIKDCVRHEWVSMRLVQAMRDGKSWDEAWHQVGRNEVWLKNEPFIPKQQQMQSIATAWDALDYLVVSHHRLLGPAGGTSSPDSSNHFSDEPLNREALKPKSPLPSHVFDTVQRLMGRIFKLTEGANHRYWRAVATIARAGLILADHQVSAEAHPDKAELYANTKDRQFNQSLAWHLENVANSASDWVYRIATLRLPGLSEEAVESICQPAVEADFYWQNRAADALSASRSGSTLPMLLFNMAATGSGKTRMNARAACVLSSGSVRFAVALNLRTLTLQTGDAFREQLNVGEDELACIIGDKVTQTLHEGSRKEDADTDGNEAEAQFEATSDAFSLPGWLEPLVKTKPLLRSVIAAPLLVSTVDYLVAAGMPHRQGHHASVLLRLIDSDLVLDEVDGYDPKPLVAILRLVQMASLLGRNVICSTATLAKPVAEAVYTAFRSGAELRGAMLGESTAFTCGLIDNYTAPSIAENCAMLDFPRFYSEHVARAKPGFKQVRARTPYLQTVNDLTEAAWNQAVLSAVQRLHGDHGWLHRPTSKRISFGLVRVANIIPAIDTARFLADKMPQARVACYHSQDFVIQRFLKEKRLDKLLTRKVGNGAIEQDTEINALLRRADTEEVMFIVVATPVEEVGRDHDFDWAVIEPSSTRSIVQTAGRVNRHRKLAVASPNIAVMQYNRRKVTAKKPVFCHPGFEDSETVFPSHDLTSLLDWPRLQSLDAGLMFDGHTFAEWDNKSIQNTLDKVSRRLFDANNETLSWVTQGIYQQYPLRDELEQRIEARLDDEGNYRILLMEAGIQKWVERKPVNETPRITNDWLAWNHEELVAACDAFGLSQEQGMRFSVRSDSFSLDLSFGAY